MASALALPAIYAALVARFKGDLTLSGLVAPAPAAIGGAGIYNRVPQGASRPYLVVGAGTEIPFNTMGDVDTAAKWGGNCTVVLKAVSEQSTELEALNILARAKVLVDGKPLTVAGFPSAECSFDSLQPVFQEDVTGVKFPLLHAPMIVRVYAHQAA